MMRKKLGETNQPPQPLSSFDSIELLEGEHEVVDGLLILLR